ncbi:Lipoprotein-releasing system ATP-binding protein LolD [Chromobacterium violaceum]|uniref:Lipoprotein-releasing system ATP-binding protein LolD n=1 Tax=Chromobacterium violaceum TaxID=536 RepID=A0A447TJA3_CHRVL|nr:Lipoprotein-releasing system ATP-binding protein LolD [Chromobacterium violaceum]
MQTIERMNHPEKKKAVLAASELAKQVHFRGDVLHILRSASLTLYPGESVAIVGTSGSGKSTLLSLLAGLDHPSDGEVALFGKPLSRLSEDARALLRRDRVGFVFQNFQLLPQLTALENVMLPLELAGRNDAREAARQMLERVGLSARLGHYPRHLSGGEQQRVALARAFVIHPASCSPTSHRQPRSAHRPPDHRPAVPAQRRAGHGAGAGHSRHRAGQPLRRDLPPGGRQAERSARRMTLLGRFRFVARFIRRELAAGELTILGLALLVAVAAMSSVAFFSDRVEKALTTQATQLLAADLVLSGNETAPDAVRAEAKRRGLETADNITFPSMAFAGGQATLAQYKAVSAGYPLRGETTVRLLDGGEKSGRLQPAPGTAWADARLISRLKLKLGDEIGVGNAQLRLAGVIVREPDGSMDIYNFVPRLMFNSADLPATGLVQEGSRIRWRLLFAGEDRQVADFRAWLRTHKPKGPGWKTWRRCGRKSAPAWSARGVSSA